MAFIVYDCLAENKKGTRRSMSSGGLDVKALK